MHNHVLEQNLILPEIDPAALTPILNCVIMVQLFLAKNLKTCSSHELVVLKHRFNLSGSEPLQETGVK